MENPTPPYETLWKAVLELPALLPSHSVHGPDHWRRVERNAMILATRTGAIVPVVRLFALFHDSRRENDHRDPRHGARGAELATLLRGKLYDLPDEHFTLLEHACVWHTDADHHDDPTIGTCWDADRLDLGRVGITPHPKYMSTEFSRQIAASGSIAPWLHLVTTSRNTTPQPDH